VCRGAAREVHAEEGCDVKKRPGAARPPFVVRKLGTKWWVLERVWDLASRTAGASCRAVASWDTREQAREAARQLNREER
jgi:hypothetical protein